MPWARSAARQVSRSSSTRCSIRTSVCARRPSTRWPTSAESNLHWHWPLPLKDADASLRAEVVDALGEIGGQTAIRLLRWASMDSRQSGAGRSCRSLGRASSPLRWQAAPITKRTDFQPAMPALSTSRRRRPSSLQIQVGPAPRWRSHATSRRLPGLNQYGGRRDRSRYTSPTPGCDSSSGRAQLPAVTTSTGALKRRCSIRVRVSRMTISPIAPKRTTSGRARKCVTGSRCSETDGRRAVGPSSNGLHGMDSVFGVPCF